LDRPPIFTVGYSQRSPDEFIALLRQHALAFLVDVRPQPSPPARPEFSRDALEERLRHVGIRYVFLGDHLGGDPADGSCCGNSEADLDRRRRQPGFREGIARLRIAWEKAVRVALMCSEGKPEECHRSKLIGVSLTRDSIAVLHIDENGELLTQEQVELRAPRPAGAVPPAPAAAAVEEPRKSYCVAEIRQRYNQAYAPWTERDDDYLCQRVLEGASIDDLVSEFGRQPGGIRSRIRKLGLELPRGTAPAGADSGKGRPAWREQYPRAGRVWTPDEDKTLLREVEAGLPLEDIARSLGRGVFSVQVRLFKLGRGPSPPGGQITS